jgi:hypothetical protein
MDRMKLVTFRIEPENFASLQKISKTEYRSVSEQIRLYVEKGIKSDSKKI